MEHYKCHKKNVRTVAPFSDIEQLKRRRMRETVYKLKYEREGRNFHYCVEKIILFFATLSF